jgi:hypothetical protein
LRRPASVEAPLSLTPPPLEPSGVRRGPVDTTSATRHWHLALHCRPLELQWQLAALADRIESLNLKIPAS